MKLCVIDDEKIQCERYTRMIHDYDPSITVHCFYSAESFLFAHENNVPYDGILLDIQLCKDDKRSMNGIELAHKIREIDDTVMIVFLTGIRDYVFEGYEVRAMRYVLKPITQEKMKELLKVFEKNQTKERAYLMLQNQKLYYDEILYVESFGHYCHIHMKQVLEIKISIHALWKELGESFMMTHRSYIVNLNHVDAVYKDRCVLDDGKEIPISRASYKKVQEAFMQHMKGGFLS